MKKRTLMLCMVAACLAFLFMLSACAENAAGNTETKAEGESGGVAEQEEGKTSGRLYFGKDKNGALLMDDNGVLMWIYPTEAGMLDSYDTGDRVTVTHGPVMLSYPGQTNMSGITLISDGDGSVFTEEELEEIATVIDGFR